MQMLKKIILDKINPFFFRELQLVTVLLLVRNSYAS